MPDLTADALLTTASVAIRDVHCLGSHRAQGAEEATTATHLVFPYRGVYVRAVGRDQMVADPTQLVFFNAGEAYRIAHPVTGGDHNLDITVSDPLLLELAPADLLQRGDVPMFRPHRVRIDARAQVLVALLRHALSHGEIEPLEAESLALTLVRRALGPRTTHAPAATATRQRLVDRVKVLLSSDMARRWTLGEISSHVGYSPVYLTQVFQQVERLPLYRYQLRLRLARALDLLPRCEDITGLALELGFSSHSHFTTAFRQAYGRSPSDFRRLAQPSSSAGDRESS